MFKSYTIGKIVQILKSHEVEFISAEFGVSLLSSPSGSKFGNVRWCPPLALDSLLKSTSSLQSVAVSSRFGCVWAGPSYSVQLVFYQHKTQG